MFKFDEILKKSQKSIDRNIIYSEEDAQAFYKAVKKFFENNPNATDKDAEKYFQEMFTDMNEKFASINGFRSYVLMANIGKYLQKNPSLFERYYNEVIKEENRTGKIKEYDGPYPSEIAGSSKRIVSELLIALRNSKVQVGNDEIEFIKKYEKCDRKTQRMIEGTLNSEGRRRLKVLIMLFSGDEKDQTFKTLETQVSAIQASLRERYKSTLVSIGEYFKQFDLLPKYCKYQQKKLEKFGKDYAGLGYSSKTENGDMGVNDLFNLDNLDKLNDIQLLVLNSFWVNRLSKEINSMNQTAFIVKKLNLWKQIKDAIPENDGKIKIEIDEESLKSVYERMNFLKEVLRKIFKTAFMSKEDAEEIVDEKGHKIIRANLNKYIDQAHADMQSKYKNYFSTGKKSEKISLIEDLDDYRNLENSKENSYRVKDSNVIALLSMLYQNDFIKNWGIIVEDTMKKEADKILIGADVEGLNMPFRLHIDRKKVIDFVSANRGSSYMPIYEGSRDFMFQERNIGTQVLMPLTQKQRSTLATLNKSQTETNQELKNYSSHLYFLAHPEVYPDHLKIPVTKKKKGKTKQVLEIPAKRYMNLRTGEIYIRDKDGVYQKEDTVQSEGR